MEGVVLNPIYWWYSVVVKNYFIHTYLNYMFLLYKTNTLPMVKYLFYPLFGTTGLYNRAISLFLRFWWAFFGFVISTLLLIPLLIFGILLLCLPFLVLFQIYKIFT